MNPPKVSVIVAAFNAEKYLERCLDSIASQTMTDFEVIIVDDGSTDNTGVIADSFTQKDNRFSVIHKVNGGVASARQSGIERATGLYSIHVDSDDWIDPKMLEELTGFAEKEGSDMVICDFWEIYSNNKQYNQQRPDPIDSISIMGQSFNILSGSLCNKLIRHQLYRSCDISFDSEIGFEEDRLVCLKLLANNISVSYLHKAFYHYDHTQNSSSTSKTGYSPESSLLILKKIKNYCDLSPIQSYYDRAIFCLAYKSLFTPRFPNNRYIQLFKEFLPNIRRASGFPLYERLFIYLRFLHIRLPFRFGKRIYQLLKSSS
jgi:glycosyltransferase involved in cell wall biosynthesis